MPHPVFFDIVLLYVAVGMCVHLIVWNGMSGLLQMFLAVAYAASKRAWSVTIAKQIYMLSFAIISLYAALVLIEVLRGPYV